MSKAAVHAFRWTCDYYQPQDVTPAGLFCKGSALTAEETMPHGWLSVEGRDLCPECVRRREYDTRSAALRAELVACSEALASAGLPGATQATRGFHDRLAVNVQGVEVTIYREGDKNVRWRARGKLAGDRSLDTASPDPTRLARTVLREVERAKATKGVA